MRRVCGALPEQAMINCCFNLACRQEFRYLLAGSLYQWETGQGAEFRSEFFWLCPACTLILKVVADETGHPAVAASSFQGIPSERCSRIRRVLAGFTPSRQQRFNTQQSRNHRICDERRS